MKNQYFGDVNDYRKYGLLRILLDGEQFRIGVCWMLTINDGLTDGRFISYLNEPEKWRSYDTPLFDLLHKLVILDGTRDVKLIQNEQILPRTKFYDELLTDAIGQRQIYFEQVRRQLFDIDLIFFDPDNGIETKSTLKGSKNSSKYIYWDELSEIFASGCSILVYQHFRREERTAFIKRMVSEYQSRLGTAEVYYFRTLQVVYFLVAQPQHVEHIRASILQVAEVWGISNQIMAG